MKNWPGNRHGDGQHPRQRKPFTRRQKRAPHHPYSRYEAQPRRQGSACGEWRKGPSKNGGKQTTRGSTRSPRADSSAAPSCDVVFRQSRWHRLPLLLPSRLRPGVRRHKCCRQLTAPNRTLYDRRNMAAPRPDGIPTPPPPTPIPRVGTEEDDAAAGAWQILSKRRRRRQRLTPILLPARETAWIVLFGPAGGASFLSASPDAISRELAAIAGGLEVRVNVQRKVVDADGASPECLARLLDVTSLCGLSVHGREPIGRNFSRVIIYGIDVNISTADLFAGLETAVPLISARRAGQGDLCLHFAGASPPQKVWLFKRPAWGRACRPRPLQCKRCWWLGHATAA
ncbi:hypothetical protein HPB48_013035 [Haemaphysalis longicornis]|uniref:Uncharacterized protein n=1 Tax=Haemaphysalis longicornis TaxID=44386 RepID=A0A9J6GTB6_HAELO|nr:hypothetical protein HPB48_013035 [Haemaphysalis longicornis]